MGQSLNHESFKEIINRIDFNKIFKGLSIGHIIDILISTNVLNEYDYMQIWMFVSIFLYRKQTRRYTPPTVLYYNYYF